MALVATIGPVMCSQAVSGRVPSCLAHHLKSGLRSTVRPFTLRLGDWSGLAWEENLPANREPASIAVSQNCRVFMTAA
jgi:hypothetical protein